MLFCSNSFEFLQDIFPAKDLLLAWIWNFLDDTAEEAKDEDEKQGDYALTVKGNVKDSIMRTAADHDVIVEGNIEDSKIYSIRSKPKECRNNYKKINYWFASEEKPDVMMVDNEPKQKKDKELKTLNLKTHNLDREQKKTENKTEIRTEKTENKTEIRTEKTEKNI